MREPRLVIFGRSVRLSPPLVGGALAALFALVAVVLLAIAVLGSSEAESTAARFVAAWERGDHRAMHAMVTPEVQARIGEPAFGFAYRQADLTATTTNVAAGEPAESDGLVTVPITVSTTAFGDVRQPLELRTEDERVAWTPNLVFPGLRAGETLTRTTRAPKRAKLLTRDGDTLVEGAADARSSPLAATASAVAGTVGPATTDEERDKLYARGFPREASVGLTGLERVFERELAGTPGGMLRAGDRELARSEPRRGEDVETTIDADLHESVVSRLGERAGAIVVLDARSGQMRALAGDGISVAQPPGSTFKVVTTTAALESGVVKPDERFPMETGAVIDGVRVRNAGGESCGGTFRDSFAHSCNSVFAPLGVEIGRRRLVETAERYGVNQPPAIPSAARSTMPAPSEIESDLELGATAIGQGKLLTTPLRMASISQAIAADGEMTPPSVAADAPAASPSRVTSPGIAETIGELMVGVVDYGTGERAAVSGVEVAGKTGTAELGPEVKEHAWFIAFAPAKRPRLALAVMIANGGAGGEVAAPVAQSVLESGLRR